MKTHLRLQKADGSFQYDSDLGCFYYRSAGVVQTTTRIRSNTSPSTALIPININDDSFIAVWGYFTYARGGTITIDGQLYDIYQTDAPPGANFYYWVLGSVAELPYSGMLKTRNDQGQTTFSSNKPPVVGVGILGGPNAQTPVLDPGRQYATVAPIIAGWSRLYYDGSRSEYEDGKTTKLQWDGYNDGKLLGVNWNGSSFSIQPVSFNDIGTFDRGDAQPPSYQSFWDQPLTDVMVIDITATGQLAIGGGPPQLSASISPSGTAHSSTDTYYAFGSFQIVATGAGSQPVGFQWFLDNQTGGTWSINDNGYATTVNVTGVTGQTTASATLRGVVTFANGQTATATTPLSHFNSASQGSNVQVSLPAQSGSGRVNAFTFSAASVNVTGGTPSSYNWYFTGTENGSWSIQSGQGSNSMTARVSSAVRGDTSRATVCCDVVVNGTTYTASAPFTYDYNY